MKKFFAVLGILGLGMTTSVSFASKSKPHVYPATEDTPSEEVISSAPGYRGQAIDDSAPSAIVQVEDAPSPSRPRIAAGNTRAQKATPPATAQYDSVPSAQAEPVIRRLRLVQELITKYGRAYDYRALTLTELQAILGDLDLRAAEASELRNRMSARSEMKKQVEAAPANDEVVHPPAPPAEDSRDSIGSEAPSEN